jgi:DNA replication protein DnaC
MLVSGNVARFCECREGKIYRRILEKSGISEEFQKKTFENYMVDNETTGKALRMAKNYASDFDNIRRYKNNSIAFLGKVGTGKTHLSIAIANKLMRKNIGVLYMQYRDVMTILKQHTIRHKDDDQDIYQVEINKLKTAPVLLIDDLYKGRTSESDPSIMFEVINYRYLKNAPIIVSSEFFTDKLLDFDEAVGSRIIEMCYGNIVEFSGETKNYRLGGPQ